MWAWLTLAGLALAQDVAVVGEVVYPVSGPPIENGVVLVKDGRIAAVGSADSVAIPAGTRTLKGAVVTPGLVDGLSQVGLTGVYNSGSDQDHREGVGAVHPELRAIDAYNGWEPLVGWLRDHGVTTAVVGPSPGGNVAGRSAVLTLAPGDADTHALVSDGAMVFTLGGAAKNQQQGPGSRMGSAAEIRQALAGAVEYTERRTLPAKDRPPVDLGKQALAEVVGGKRRAVVVAHRADDLLTAIRIGEEYGLDLVLAGAAEAYLVADAIAAAEVPVLLGPVMVRAWGEDSEAANASYEAGRILVDAGVKLGFMGGFEGYVPKVRVVLWEAGIAAGWGLGLERALEAATLRTAEIAGVSDQVGSLDVGKRADLAIFTGDPFEYTTRVCWTLTAGTDHGPHSEALPAPSVTEPVGAADPACSVE